METYSWFSTGCKLTPYSEHNVENRVIANLAHEDTLIKMYEADLDGHCVNSLYYFREEIAQHLPLTGDLVVDAKAYAHAVDVGNKELKDIRQRGKPPTFGLQYGAHPPKIASTIKCSIEEATQIFNRYHNELYSNVTKFREEVVIPAATQNGEIHMGLGAKIATDNPSSDERTLVNSCSQYWSILTLFAINKLHQAIDDNNLSDKILVTNSIYDAIYGEIDNDPELIDWLNQTIVPIMTTPFIEQEVVHNLCDLEIGTDWASFHKIENTATITDITTLLTTIQQDSQ